MMPEQPSNPYVVRTIVLDSGERLPLLCRRQSGLPLFEPTLYALTQLRARSRASSTIQQALRAVMVFCMTLDRLGVDLDVRLAEARLLELGEIDAVVTDCKLSLDDRPEPATGSRVDDRRRSSRHRAEVSLGTSAVRIQYINDYLTWLATDRLLRTAPKSPRHASLKATADAVRCAMRERVPSSSRTAGPASRRGLSPEALAWLEHVIVPDSPDNPWVGNHAKERNRLILRWLLQLGLRRGELLGVRIPDINFQANEILIARRADNPDDPRRTQPNTKTCDRLLFADDDLMSLTHDYVTGARRAMPNARKHDFLFVANGSGAPLTLGALNKLFVALRNRCRRAPQDLTPHVLRHTWNDLFSEAMDKNKVSEDVEKRARARLMGWSPTSKSAATYTRRHVQRVAREVSLQLQRQMKPGDRYAD